MLGLTSAKPATGESLDSRYSRYKGFHVLKLSGDDYEMGYQHGALLADAIKRGPIPYFERYVERMLGSTTNPTIGNALALAVRESVGRKIGRGFPDHARRAMDGLADGAGLSRRKLLAACTMPESYLWVLGKLISARKPGAAPRHGVPLMGCTSAVAFGAATKDGELLHGRNFDYQGVGVWDQEQAIVFHQPNDGQPYVSIAAAGVLFGGITAMNSAGLSLVVHQHMASTSLTLGNTPIGITGDQIMRHARTLDDARRILDEDRPNGCWTYVISSGHEKRVLCYETTPEGKRAHLIDSDTFGYSNVFLDPALGARECHLYPTHWRNNLARLKHSNRLLEEQRGEIDENAIAKVLGYTGDGCRFEEAIAQLMTVASVVFRPAQGLVYVAGGRVPVSNHEYVAFDLNRQGPREDLEPLSGGRRTGPAAEAFDHYAEAYTAYFDDQDLPRARRSLALAVERSPEEPVYHYMAALLALLDGDLASSESGLNAALDLGHPLPERRAGFHLWRGRVRDLSGRRAAAADDYRNASESSDPDVRRAARRGLNKPWKRRRFGLEFALADVPAP